MATHKLTLKVKTHWFDRWLYLPYLRTLAVLGFEFDVEKALEPMTARMIVQTVSGKRVKTCVRV